MNLNDINSLKQKGNDAFKLGNLEESLGHYTKAIEMIGPDGDKKTAAIILSNRAQVHLKMEKYQQALEDADKSLEYDPNFRKSTLRRAMANAELGNNTGAMEDLRKILPLEPGNSTIRSLLKRVSEPVKIDSQLREAYGGHYFRRWMTDRRRMALEGSCYYYDCVRVPILRQSFLSVENSVFMRKVLSGSTIASDPVGSMLFWLPRWFVSKRMKIDVRSFTLICGIPCKTFSTLYYVVRPFINLSVGLSDGGLARQLESMHKYEEVFHCKDSYFRPPHIGPRDIQAIKGASRILTRLPYCAEIVKFKDKTLPMVNTLVIASTQVVDMAFLKLWKRQQWRIKNVVALGGVSNLLNFERFEGIISNHVTHVWMSCSISNPDDFHEKDQVEQFKNNMQTLKRVFPMLDSVTVSLDFTYPLCVSPGIPRNVKRHISYLINNNFVHHLKPDWCREFKVAMVFAGLFEPEAQPVSVSLQPLERLVKECRGEMTQFKYIRLRGPIDQKFGGYTVSCFAAIEMATDDAEFQVVFQPLSSFPQTSTISRMFLH